MKRTTWIIAGLFAVATLAVVAPASADLFAGMPGMNTMQLYNQNMAQFGGGGGWGGGLTMGMPTTNIWQDYNTLLPQLQALQAWGHAMGMPYALPGTLGGYGTEINGSTAASYWGDKWAHELIRGDEPIYQNNGAHISIYPDDMGY